MRTLLTLLLLSTSTVFSAELTHSKEAKDFDYIYTLDVDPSTQDLDNNGAPDWAAKAPLKLSGGFATNSAEDSAKYQGIQLYQGDFTIGDKPSIFRALGSAPDAAWTLEVSVARLSGTVGQKGWFGIATSNKDEGNSNVFLMKNDKVTTSMGDHLLGSNFITGKYHKIRIVHAPAKNAYYFWVDGRIVNYNTRTPIHGDNGNRLTNGIYIGDYSSGISGNFSIDSIALTKGAFAPVSSKLPLKGSSRTKKMIAKAPQHTASTLISFGGINLSLKPHN